MITFIIGGILRGVVCLAIPGKIVSIDVKTKQAVVDYGSGTKRSANISLVEAKIGEYVLVHAGFAIQVLKKREAKETLALFREMMALAEV
jgi:hydrogenase expression/formation protein HypC